jgi:hypothetical protein
MTDELKDVTPVNSTLDDLLSNPFEAPDTSKLSVQEDKKITNKYLCSNQSY